MTACDACLRRTQLLELVAGGLEVAWQQRRPLRDVLALDDAALVAAVAGRQGPALLERVAALPAPGDMVQRAAARGLRVLCRHTPGYPAALRDDRSAPAALFVAAAAPEPLAELFGDAPGGGPPVVAIVGTRRASPEGLEVARLLGRGLAAAGVAVVSGMALGVDSAAHAGALEGGGATVAVLAGGADVPYPARKRRLYDEIRATGAVLSEMPPGFRAFRWCFPARNRIIAALGAATIVVEAAERSGSLITAELALELGRDVGAVPGPVLNWRSRGVNALLRDGATLVRDARDALDLVLGLDGVRPAPRAADVPVRPPAGLAPELRVLLDAVEQGRDTLSTLASDAAAAGRARAGLMELELLGLVRRGPGGRMVRVLGGELL